MEAVAVVHRAVVQYCPNIPLLRYNSGGWKNMELGSTHPHVAPCSVTTCGSKSVLRVTFHIQVPHLLCVHLLTHRYCDLVWGVFFPDCSKYKLRVIFWISNIFPTIEHFGQWHIHDICLRRCIPPVLIPEYHQLLISNTRRWEDCAPSTTRIEQNA